MISRFLLVALTLQLVGLSSNQNVQNVKLVDDQKIDSIAGLVCESRSDRDRQIGRISTVAKLLKYFDSLGEGSSKLHKCRDQHYEALATLQQVVSVRNDNVCSEDKLNLIDEYHNQYVSTQVEHVKSRSETKKERAPLVLNLFFMHYAMEVNAMCRTTLINNLEWDLKQTFGRDLDERLVEIESLTQGMDRTSFGAIFNGAVNNFMELFSVENYDDVLMFWDIIQGSVLSQENEAKMIREEYDPVTGEPIRMLIKVKKPDYLNAIRDYCHYSLKPIYKQLIMPLIRLADLGYSNNAEKFKIELQELKTNRLVKRWYALTQLCETLLPIKIYPGPELEPHDVVILTKEEAQKLDAELPNAEDEAQNDDDGQRKKVLVYEPQSNTMVGVDLLDSVGTIEGQKLVSEVKSNIGTRDRAVKRVLVHLLKTLKNKISSFKVGRFFFPVKGDQLVHPKGSHTEEVQKGHRDMNEQFAQSLERISESDLMNMSGAIDRKSRVIPKKALNGRSVDRKGRYMRKGDIDSLLEIRAEAISYKQTKSWSEIFSGVTKFFEAIAPSRMQMIIGGSVLIVIFAIAFLTAFIVAVAVSPG